MKIKGILFDLEGVLLEAKTHHVLPGALELLDHCRKHLFAHAIISNNTLVVPDDLLLLLKERGFSIDASQLLTPLRLLRTELSAIDSALLIGSQQLQEFVEAYGTRVVDTAAADAVICGGGYDISNDILANAYTAIAEQNARFLCLHRNRIFKDAEGRVRPDVGCMVAGLEYASGKTAKTLGKPSKEYFMEAIAGWKVEPANILLISDDPISDLGGGRKCGFQTAFVATGKYTADSLQAIPQKPDYCWSTLTEGLSELNV